MDKPFMETIVYIFSSCEEYRHEVRPDPDGLGGIEIAYQEYDRETKSWVERTCSGFIEPDIADRLGEAIAKVRQGTDEI